MRKLLTILAILVISSQAHGKVLTYTIGASADDSSVASGSGYTDSNLPMPYGDGTRWTWLRFPLSVPDNATITNAVVDFVVSSGGKYSVQIDVADLDNIPSFVTNPRDYSVLGSPVSGVFTGTWTSGLTVTTPDITSLIEAFMARGGYVYGNYIGLKFGRATTATSSWVKSFDTGSTNAPVLKITYTGGDVMIDLWMADPYVRTKQYIYPHFTNQDAGDILYVYLDDELKHQYTFTGDDIPSNITQYVEKEYLLDYTALTAGEHHIDVIVKTSGGTARGTATKTWTTTHNGYPKVGITENNFFCIENAEGTGCTLFFPIQNFMWDKPRWNNCADPWASPCLPFTEALNGLDFVGYYTQHTPTTYADFLNAANNRVDTPTGMPWKVSGPGRGEFTMIGRNSSCLVNTYKMAPEATYNVTPNGHYYKCTTAGTTAATFVDYCETSGCEQIDGTSVWTEQGEYTGGYAGIAATNNSDCVSPASAFECGYVRQLKDHAAIFGWKWEDEPSLGGITVCELPPYLRGMYEGTKTADTDHPHIMLHYGYDFMDGSSLNGPILSYSWLTNSGSFNGVKSWISDVTGGDIYPYGFVKADHTLVYVGGAAVTLESMLAAEDNYLAYNYGLAPYITIPAPNELRSTATDGKTTCNDEVKHPLEHQLTNELWLRIIHGASGMNYFPYFCQQETYQVSAAGDFKALLDSGTNPLAPVVMTPRALDYYTPETKNVNSPGSGIVNVQLNFDTVLAGADGRVDYMVKEYNGDLWVFAARVKKRTGETFENCTEYCVGGGVWPDANNENPKDAIIPITGLADSTTIEVYGETRNVISDEGSFTDSFLDYDVHIYKVGDIATTFDLTVTKDGTGEGTVASSPGGISCGATCTSSFVSGEVVTLTASPSGTNTFGGWTGAGCSGTGTCVVTMSEARAVTATFTLPPPPKYTVTISGSGTGSGVTDPILGDHEYTEEGAVAITQTPGQNASFTGWSGTCGCSGVGNCEFTMPGNDCTAIATWAVDEQYTLTVSPPTNGEIVTSDVGDISCSMASTDRCVAVYDVDTVVTLTTLLPDYRRHLDYTEDCSGETCVLTMTADKTVGITTDRVPVGAGVSPGGAKSKGYGKGGVKSHDIKNAN